MNDDTIASNLPSTPQLALELDWEQYFKDFCEAHGKYPVLHGDLLLFQDGWRYDSLDHMGPEYPPPKDKQELASLQRIYYQRRLEIVRAEFIRLSQTIDQLEILQRGKSVPLSQRVTYKDSEGKTVTSHQRIDMVMLRKRLEWLSNDVDECRKKLAELESTNGYHRV